ncbi:MAG: HNH endonuclease signature motif containing protein [Nanoarchaeota archaeon]
MPKGIPKNGENKGWFKKGNNKLKNAYKWEKGHITSEETKRKIGIANSTSQKGKKLSEETKRKIGKALEGEKCHLWRGGISFEPYGLEFNEDLKEVIRNRDRRKCQICKKTELECKEKLSIHHIDYDKKNNDPKNLISLCRNCHMKSNFNRKNWKKLLELDGKTYEAVIV